METSFTNIVKPETCPYCQTRIKAGADKIVCTACGTPHHKECWEENKGCTTFGCVNNPHTEKPEEPVRERSGEVIDVGSQTPEEIEHELHIVEPVVPSSNKLINCPQCRSLIEENSVFCKFCGHSLHGANIPDAAERRKFDEEFQKRYKSKASFKRKRLLITAGSVLTILLVLFLGGYAIVNYINGYFASEDFIIKERISAWEKAWESRTIDNYKAFLSEDYIYIGTDGKKINYEQRLNRIEWTFQNYKYIILDLSNIKITEDAAKKEATVTFNERYTSDKYREEGTKTLKLKKDAEGKWMIYQETFK